MSFVRISLMKPKARQGRAARDLLEKLACYHQQQLGYVFGYTLASTDGGIEIGRVSVWADEQAANRAATTRHDLSLRSQLNLVIEPGSHRESSFDGTSSHAPAGTELAREHARIA
jgi:hypothetical protein